MDNLFAKQAPFIILTNVALLHFIGYVLQNNFFQNSAWLIWLSVGLIDAVFGYKCGVYIKSIFKDSLTGLYNRSFLFLFLDKELANPKGSISLLMLDIDDYKRINDNYGHLMGDIILKQVSTLLKTNLRPNDCAFRWGGDEFIIVLPATDKAIAMKIAERLRAVFTEFDFNSPPAVLRLTVSIGVACVSNSIDKDALVNLADKALYKAKAHKNVVMTNDS